MVIKGVFESREIDGLRMNYMLTYPDDKRPDEALPLVLALHGAGERGTDVERVKIHGLAKYFAADSGYLGLRAVTLSPQCPEGVVWNNIVFALKELCDTVAADLGTDRDRTSVTGLSMGGFGTWEMICCYPHYFRRAAPICGGGLSWRADLAKDVEIRAFHGDADKTVPLIYSQLMVDKVKAAGGNAVLTVYEGVPHNSWDRAYSEPDLIPWLCFADEK